MGPLGRTLVAAGAVAAAVVLFFVLRPDGEETSSPAAPTATAPGTTTEAEPGQTETGAEAETEGEDEGPSRRVIRLDVRAGDPQIERVEVERGSTVVLVVEADVADHVHVHGYDLMADVAPGQPGRIRFRASIPGRFEIELEDRHQPIAELTVNQ